MRALFVLLLLLPAAFPMLMDCNEMEKICFEAVCEQAGGIPGEYSGCSETPDFDPDFYMNATEECRIMTAQCIESGGAVLPPRNMSCCGPVFILLLALAIAFHRP